MEGAGGVANAIALFGGTSQRRPSQTQQQQQQQQQQAPNFNENSNAALHQSGPGGVAAAAGGGGAGGAQGGGGGGGMRQPPPPQQPPAGVVGTTGIHFVPTPSGLVIAKLDPNSPAFNCGLIERNDVLVTVNDRDITSLPPEEVVRLLVGPPGQVVRLGLYRLSQYYTVEIVRQQPLPHHPQPSMFGPNNNNNNNANNSGNLIPPPPNPINPVVAAGGGGGGGGVMYVGGANVPPSYDQTSVGSATPSLASTMTTSTAHNNNNNNNITPIPHQQQQLGGGGERAIGSEVISDVGTEQIPRPSTGNLTPSSTPTPSNAGQHGAGMAPRGASGEVFPPNAVRDGSSGGGGSGRSVVAVAAAAGQVLPPLQQHQQQFDEPLENETIKTVVIRQLKSQLRTNEAELAEREQRISDLMNQVTTISQINEELKTTLLAANSHNDELQKRLMATSPSDSAELIAKLNEKIASLESDIAAKDRVIRALTEEVEQKDALNASKSASTTSALPGTDSAELARIISQLQEKQRTIDELRVDLSKRALESDAHRSLVDEKQRLIEQLREDAQRRNVEQTEQVHFIEKLRAQASLAQLQEAKIRDMEKQQGDLFSEVEMLRDQCLRGRTAHSVLMRHVTVHKDRQAELEAELNAVRRELARRKSVDFSTPEKAKMAAALAKTSETAAGAAAVDGETTKTSEGDGATTTISTPHSTKSSTIDEEFNKDIIEAEEKAALLSKKLERAQEHVASLEARATIAELANIECRNREQSLHKEIASLKAELEAINRDAITKASSASTSASILAAAATTQAVNDMRIKTLEEKLEDAEAKAVSSDQLVLSLQQQIRSLQLNGGNAPAVSSSTTTSGNSYSAPAYGSYPASSSSSSSVKSLHDAQHELSEALQAAQRKIADREKELADVRRLLSMRERTQKEPANKRLTPSQVYQLAEEKKSLQIEVDAMKQHIENLSTELATLKSSSSSSTALVNSGNGSTATPPLSPSPAASFVSASSELVSMIRTLHSKDERIINLELQLSSINKELHSTQGEFDQLRSRLTEAERLQFPPLPPLSTVLELEVVSNEDNSSSLRKINVELIEELRITQSELETCKSRLLSRTPSGSPSDDERVTKLSAELLEAKAKLETTEATSQQLQKQVVQLQQQLFDLQQQQQQSTIDSSFATVKSPTGSEISSSEASEATHAKMAEIQAELDKEKRRAIDMAEETLLLQQKAKDLEDKLRSAKEDFVTLETERIRLESELGTELKNLAIAKEQISERNAIIVDLEKRIASLNRDVDDRNDRLLRLETQVSQLQDQLRIAREVGGAAIAAGEVGGGGGGADNDKLKQILGDMEVLNRRLADSEQLLRQREEEFVLRDRDSRSRQEAADLKIVQLEEECRRMGEDFNRLEVERDRLQDAYQAAKAKIRSSSGSDGGAGAAAGSEAASDRSTDLSLHSAVGGGYGNVAGGARPSPSSDSMYSSHSGLDGQQQHQQQQDYHHQAYSENSPQRQQMMLNNSMSRQYGAGGYPPPPPPQQQQQPYPNANLHYPAAPSPGVMMGGGGRMTPQPGYAPQHQLQPQHQAFLPQYQQQQQPSMYPYGGGQQHQHQQPQRQPPPPGYYNNNNNNSSGGNNDGSIVL